MKTRISLLLVIVTLFWLTACSSDSDEAAPTAVPAAPAASQPAAATSAPTTAPASASTQVAASAVTFADDPKEAILTAMGLMADRPFRSLSTITGDGFAMQITGEFSPPDAMRILTQLKDSPDREIIVIGAQGWQRMGEEGWTEMAADVVALVNQQGGLVPHLEMLSESITAASLVGPEEVDGVPAMLYTITSLFDAGKPTEMSSAAKVWIAIASGLPIKQEVTGGGSLTVQRIEYKQVPPVTAPAP